MEDSNFIFPGEESVPLVPTLCEPTNIMISIMQEANTLVVYEDKVPMGASHRAAIKHNDSFHHCVAQPFKNIDEARRIYNLLIICEHPNLHRPLGLWACEDGLSFNKTKTEKDLNGQDDALKVKKEKVMFKAFIAFPNFDGVLADISRKEMFLVENDSSTSTKAYGFTCQGSKLFCHILDVVDYINSLYGASFPLYQLRVNLGRIIYKKVVGGEYHVILWADFFIDPKHMRNKTGSGKSKDLTADDVRSANLRSIGICLKDWFGRCKIEPNEELQQLQTVLDGTTLMCNDIKWEPGLWSVNIKILFIREIFWCMDNEQTREVKLKLIPSLGLKNCISKLGFDDNDGSLFDSVMFLRNKIVAHQNSLYKYGGKNDDVGLHNQITEIRIQKENPDYMIKLVKEMRRLNWIEKSPLLRSSTAYIKPFRHPKC